MAETREIKESPVFVLLQAMLLEIHRFAELRTGRIPPSPPDSQQIKERFSDST